MSFWGYKKYIPHFIGEFTTMRDPKDKDPPQIVGFPCSQDPNQVPPNVGEPPRPIS